MLVRALRHFPDIPAIHVVHDATSRMDAPFSHPRVVRHVAVDLRCRARLVEAGIAETQTALILNAVDLDRFLPRAPLPEKPRRALVFSNYAGRDTHLPCLAQACQAAGLTLDVLGDASGTQSSKPEGILGRYDLVFAKARCALEAMAVGNAVILCDFSGLGSLVTARDFSRFRPMNFGAGLLTRALDSKAVIAEIQRCDARDAAQVTAMARDEACLRNAIEQWLALYRTVLDAPRPLSGEQDDMLAQRETEWRMAYLAAPLASLARSVRKWPLIGPPFYRSMRRLWHRRY